MKSLTLRQGDFVAVGSVKQMEQCQLQKVQLLYLGVSQTPDGIVKNPAEKSRWAGRTEDGQTIIVPVNQARAFWTDYESYKTNRESVLAAQQEQMSEQKKALEIILNHLGGMGIQSEIFLINGTGYKLTLDASQANAIAELRRGKK